jgi:hypothetical protein
VRRGAKRTGARTLAQIRAVWQRHRFSRWPCRRLGVPASVAPTSAGPAWHTHGCPRGSDIRRPVCPCFVVRRHGLQPAVSDFGSPRVKQGQPCGRRGDLVEGRSDRILPPAEKIVKPPPAGLSGWSGSLGCETDGLPSPCPTPVGSLECGNSLPLWYGPRARRASAPLTSLCVFHIGQSGDESPHSKGASARAPLLGWAGPETVCHLEQAVQGGAKRTGARTFAQIRAVWERHGSSRWPCRRLGVPASVAPTPAGPVRHAHGCPRGFDIRRLVCPCFVVRRHGLQPAASDYGCPRVKQGQPCGRRGDLPEGRSDRILPRQERSSNRPPPVWPAGAEHR